ncbi:hypothetical protein E2C01_073198 [Portunus trituberculatus]|uniref:Uncharacterized protein n=1 Tax=Portunus trituberculatus TaxID=210409 RepID=A0A5B7I8T3_PORTR|nr:hypothetical protein [Portunus trituberculatus]
MNQQCKQSMHYHHQYSSPQCPPFISVRRMTTVPAHPHDFIAQVVTHHSPRLTSLPPSQPPSSSVFCLISNDF